MASGNIQKYADGTDSGWLELTPDQQSGTDVYTGSIYYRKIGNILEVTGYNFTLTNQLSASSYLQLGRLPSGYRPAENKEIYGAGMTPSGTQNIRLYAIRISKDGGVLINSNAEAIPTSISLRFSAIGFL